jgi:3-phosphoshikimate 1-carboxyvinyltransferase
LAQGDSVLRGALDSEDTQVMIAALRALGIGVDASDGGRTLHVHGCGGNIPARQANLFVANSGTTMRFLTALTAVGQGSYRLDGVARMRERPMGDMIEGLRQLGVDLHGESPADCPPIVVNAAGLRGGAAEVRGEVSSQFLSGIMMSAPYAERDVQLSVSGRLVSAPYIQMTRRVMEAFGADVAASADCTQLRVSAAHRYRATEYEIEPDASAASYFLAAAAIAGGQVTVEGLTRESLQGDVAFCACLEQMGAVVMGGPDLITVQSRLLRGIDVDMNAISDTVPTLAVTALFADGPTRIRNVAHIRHKETDRIAAVACELRKLGADVDERPDGMLIRPGVIRPAAIDTYRDHRMAMSFALAGLRAAGVVIRDPQCTAKTYPDFFADLECVTRPSR